MTRYNDMPHVPDEQQARMAAEFRRDGKIGLVLVFFFAVVPFLVGLVVAT